jgi:prepilin-type N-terminal cleavage/methylation domain-containing protein
MSCQLIRMQAEARPGHFRRGQCGFTLAELLVASVVMSIALLGVYEMFRNTMSVEVAAAARWSARTAAQSAVDHVAYAVENATNSSKQPTFLAEISTTSDRAFVCQLPLERRRYAWRADGQGGRQTIFVQRKVSAGSADLSSGAEGDSQDTSEGQDEQWGHVTQAVVAKGMDSFSIRFRALDDSSAEWKEDWQGPSGQVAVWIQAAVDNQTAERVIVPAVNASAGG